MKNIAAGIMIAFVVPHIPSDFYFLASAIVFGVLAAISILVASYLIRQNNELKSELRETRLQLQYSEERRRIISQPRRKPSMRRRGAA
jgi:hypothetical protein